MHDHREILALAAAEIDFELDLEERDRLADALETCSLCRRRASAMRATATVLRRPLEIGTPGRVRGVVVGTALGRGRRMPVVRAIFAATLSIVVVLGGTVALIGSRGFGIDPSASTAPSSPTGPAVAAATAPPSPSDLPTTAPSAAAAVPTPVPDSTLRSGDVAAMVTDGRLVIRTLPETGPNSALFKTRLHPGQRVLVLEGPVDGDGYRWYRIRLGDIEGWASAADRDGTPWLTRVQNGVIAFVVEGPDGTTDSIHTIDGDGTTGETILLADASLSRFEQLTWSSDGRRLAFVATPANSTSGSTEIFTIDADGSNLTQLTHNEVDHDSPAWSPDGTRLAARVTDIDPATPEDSSIVVMPVIGSGATVLGPGADPVWSPDGQQIAMTVADGSASRLWVQAPDGSGRREVSDVPVTPERASWSPDGLRLVVSYAGTSLSPPGLSIIDVASGSATTLMDEPTTSPTWSIIGSIALSATGTGAPGLFTIRPDGTSLEQVAAFRGFEATAAWSPDGRWLLLSDEHTGSPVTLIKGTIRRQTVVESQTGITRGAAWQPVLR